MRTAIFYRFGSASVRVPEGRHAEAEELVQTAFFASPASTLGYAQVRHYEPLAGSISSRATPGGHDSNQLANVLGMSCDNPARSSVEAIEQAAMNDVSLALEQSWQALLSRHVADCQSLFNRVKLRMWPDASHISADRRIKDRRDPGGVALYHKFGRYLLISSSRNSPKPLPANLQGIWNPSFAPPWGSKLTINVTIQMNYWPTAPCNLFECALPLVDLLERMAERGRKTALVMYGCKGWCAHHSTDIWADTDPQDGWMPATLWPLAGVWVCVDMMKLARERYVIGDDGSEESAGERGCAWRGPHHTRLGDSDGAGRHMELLLKDSTLDNMLDNHPPFQIDGNFGGCTGILECLARRWEPTLYGAGVTLLPACPKGWEHAELTRASRP
ncbi:alpha-L-fucosidase [Diaporthe helianthi]|uniref:Alpha-L-fucosidase n=1 Tax=Diaporthe helianthi TaxID=158607 RepID=A0A2P5I4P1_DIAHE|nr:alpha-L-fucosidase [Diaporthe helianthi]